MIKIKSSEIKVISERGYSSSVVGRDYRGRWTDENPAAHGNICQTEAAGDVWRRVNVNQSEREEGPWMQGDVPVHVMEVD